MGEKCPIKTSPEWKLLTSQLGEDRAYFTWMAHREDYPSTLASTSVLKAKLGMKNNMSQSQIIGLKKRLSIYNTNNGTSHSFEPIRVGQADLYVPKLYINYLPKSAELVRQNAISNKTGNISFDDPKILGVDKGEQLDMFGTVEPTKDYLYEVMQIKNYLQDVTERIPGESDAQFKERVDAYLDAYRNYVYTDRIPVEVQVSVSAHLSGVMMDILTSRLTGKTPVNIYEADPVTGKQYLIIRKYMLEAFKTLFAKKKTQELTEKEEGELQLLTRIFGEGGRVYNLFEESIVRTLQSKRYKFVKGAVQTEEDGLSEVARTEADRDGEEDNPIETYIGEDITNKKDPLRNSLTVPNKETMSTAMRTFLSSIPSEQESMLSLFYNFLVDDVEIRKDFNMNYVNEDVIIKAINAAVVGDTTLEEMLKSLRDTAAALPDRAYLAKVADKLETANGEVRNQFVSKFNQQQATFITHRFDKKVNVLSSFTNDETGENESILAIGTDGKTIYEYNAKVIDANRQEAATNLRVKAKEDFYHENKLTSDVIPQHLKDSIYQSYLDFQNNAHTYLKADGTIKNVEGLKKDLDNLLKKININLSDDALRRFMIGTKNKPTNFGAPKNNYGSVFNTAAGDLHFLFEAFGRADSLDINDIYGTTGARNLFNTEAIFQELYYNTSIVNGQNNRVWAYSAPNPLSAEFYKITKELESGNYSHIKDIQSDPFRSQSALLEMFMGNAQNYTSGLGVAGRARFLENFKYTIVNALRSGNSTGKDLSTLEEREFILTQLIAFTSNAVSDGIGNTWSFKFLTTPSDKTTMYQIQTPDYKVELEKNVPVVGEATVNNFYRYFIAEYNRIMAYQTANPENKAILDSLKNTESRLFYWFPGLNLKNADNPLWNNGKLATIEDHGDYEDPIVAHIREEIKKQVEADIRTTKDAWTELGLRKGGDMVMGFPESYRRKVKDAVSLRTAIKTAKKNTDDLSPEDLANDLKAIYKKSHSNLSEYLVHEYAINYQLHNMEMQLLFLGDPVDFLKNEKFKFENRPGLFESNDIGKWETYIDSIRDSISKRMAGIQASGNVGAVDDEHKTANTVIIEDLPVMSKAIAQYRAALDAGKEDGDEKESTKFEKIDHMDGQELTSAKEDLLMRLMYGKLPRGVYDSMVKKVDGANADLKKLGYIQDHNEFTPEEKFVAQAQKPVMFALIPVRLGKKTKFKATYYKPSAFGLYPQLTKKLEIDKLREALYELELAGTRVDRLVTQSAAKLGVKAPVRGLFYQDPKTLRVGVDNKALLAIQPTNIDFIPREDLRIQLEVPYDENKESITMASQQITLIFNEIQDITFDGRSISKFLPNFKGQDATGAQLKELHEATFKELLDLSKKEVLAKIGFRENEDGTYSYKSLEKLRDMLYKQAVEQNYDMPSLEGLRLTPNKQEFIIPLSFSNNADRYEKLLLSLVKKAILQKIHGRSFILATEAGFTPQEAPQIIEGQDAKEYIKKNETGIVFVSHDKETGTGYDPTIGLLPARPNPNNPNEILPHQVLISFKYKDNEGNDLDINQYITEDAKGRKILDTSKIDKDILRILGIRIPVQGHPSIGTIEIVGFLPHLAGDLIIAPMDFTKIFGSDFDIDKLYGYMYNYQIAENGRIQRYKKAPKSVKVDETAMDEDEDFAATIAELADGEDTPDKKILQNKLQDIYHAIASNREVWEKAVVGITEGRLTKLANELRTLKKGKTPRYFSPASEQNKVREYYENKAGQTGVGIYSAMNTFATVIEGKGLELAKFQITTDKKTEKVSNPIVIIPNGEGRDPIKYSELSGSKGFNRIISAWQSASVDNAKLKVLDWINTNETTMGVSGVLAMLADDSQTHDVDGEQLPILNEDFIVYFLSQPSVVNYIKALAKGNDAISGKVANFERTTLSNEIMKLASTLEKMIGPDYLDYVEAFPGFNLNELKKNIYTPDYKDVDYHTYQLVTLMKFRELLETAGDVRSLQYVLNANSKGTSGSIDEALYKRRKVNSILSVNDFTGETKGVSTLFNAHKIFQDEDTGELTLSGKMALMGIELPVALFSETNILSSGSITTDDMIRHLSVITNKDFDKYSYKFGRDVNKALLSYMQARAEFGIQDNNKTLAQEKKMLLFGNTEEGSLGEDLDVFKASDAYRNTTILKPLMESIKIRTKDGAKFVEFQAYTGLINPTEEIIQSLEYLRRTEPKLFAKLIKYTLLMQFKGSPVSLRQFVAPFYLQGIGLSYRYRQIAGELGFEDTPTGKTNTGIMSIRAKSAYGDGMVSFFEEQFLQHNPSEAPEVEPSHARFLKEDGSITTKLTSKFLLDTSKFTQYQFSEGKQTQGSISQYAIPYLSLSDRNTDKYRLYKIAEMGKDGRVVYEEISTLGSYNLEEYDYDATKTSESLLPENNPGYRPTIKTPTTPVVSSKLGPLVNNTTGMLGNILATYFKTSLNASGEDIITSILKVTASDKNLDNPYFKELAQLLLDVNESTGFLGGLKLETSTALKGGDFYEENSHTISINTRHTAQELPYVIIHELLHAASVSNLTGEAGMQLRLRINRVIAFMESDEMLAKAITFHGLDGQVGTTVTGESAPITTAYLKDKLAAIRAGKSVSYSSEAERRILGPLVNFKEFVAMALGDTEVQKFMNTENYEDYPGEGKKSIMAKLKDLFNLFLTKLASTLGIKIGKKSLLKEALSLSLQSLDLVREDKSLNTDEESKNYLVGISPTPGVVNTPQDTTIPEKRSTDYYQTQIGAFHREKATVRKQFNQGTITAAVRDARLIDIQNKITRTQSVIDKTAAAGKFSLVNFYNDSVSELVEMKKLLNSSPTLSIEEYAQIATSFEYFNVLYSSVQEAHAGKESYVTQDLMDKVKDFKKEAGTIRDNLIEASLNAYIGEYNRETGSAITLSDIISTQGSGFFSVNTLELVVANNTLAATLGRIIGEMVSKRNSSLQEHEVIDEAAATKFLEHHKFDDITEIDNYTDLFGTKKSDKNFLGRYTGEYFRARDRVFKAAMSKGSPEAKAKAIRSGLNRISHSIDVRYLFPDLYNTEMHFYLGTANDKLHTTSRDTYKKHLLDLYKEQYKGYDPVYIEERLEEVIKYAEERFQEYLDAKAAEEVRIAALTSLPDEKRMDMLDWLSENSPFVLLNERFGLEASKGSILDAGFFGSAKYSRATPYTNSLGVTKTIRQFVKHSARKGRSERYVIKKANRIYEDGTMTGFYNDRFLDMEQDHFKKVRDKAAFVAAGNQTAADALDAVPTRYEFWKWMTDRQKYYLATIPYYLRSNLGYTAMLDVQHTVQEDLDDKLAKASKVFSLSHASFDDFLDSLKNLWIMPELLTIAWNKTARLVSERARKEDSERIDLLRNDSRKDFNPGTLNDSLNKLGVGTLKTSSLRSYLNAMRTMAVAYKVKNEAESMIRLGEFLYAKTEPLNKSTKKKFALEGKSESRLIKWTVDNKLYDSDREHEHTTFNSSKTKLFGIAAPVWKLTSEERKKYLALDLRIEELKGLYAVALRPAEKDLVDAEIAKLTKARDSIVRVMNVKTAYNIPAQFTRLLLMGGAVGGRYLDFIASSLMGGMREAADGRIFGWSEYGKAFSHVTGIFMPKAVGTSIALGGAAMLNPVTVAAGLAARTAAGVANETLRRKEYLKLSLLMKKLGAMDLAHVTSDEHVAHSSTVSTVKGEIADIASVFNPLGFTQEVEHINRSIPALATLYATPIKDLSGKTRNLYDAFTLNAKDELVWNEAEFGFQRDAGFDFVDGLNMIKTKARMRVAVKHMNGNYLDEDTIQLDSTWWGKGLQFLRRFIFQWYNARVADTHIDRSVDLEYTGSTRAILKQVLAKLETGDWSTNESVKAATRQAAFSSLWLGGVLVIGLATAFGGGDDDDSYFDDVMFFINMLMMRNFMENVAHLDPTVFRRKSVTGISPFIQIGSDVVNVLSAAGDYVTKGDLMTHSELTQNGLSTLLYKIPLYQDPMTGKMKYAQKRDYPDVSRLKYRASKLVPFMNQTIAFPKKFRPMKQGNPSFWIRDNIFGDN